MSRVLLGVVGRPHGVRGLLRVQSYTADPLALTAYGPLQDSAGRCWQLRWRGEGVAEFRDTAGRLVDTRNEAETLVNTPLFIARAQLPPPADDDDFYLADLVGLAVVDAAGQPAGSVVQVHDYGAGTSLEIVDDAGRVQMIPFTRACVPHVDIAAGRVVVVPPLSVEAGRPDAAGDHDDDACATGYDRPGQPAP